MSLFAKRLGCFLLSFCTILSFFAGCNPVDKDYGVSQDDVSSAEQIYEKIEHDEIMSSDRVMSKYFDISLFDEENYAEVYLGKKFKLDVDFLGNEIILPATLEKMSEFGWELAEGNAYNSNSLVFSYETIDVTFVNANGILINAWMYNSSRSSVTLSECKVVKIKILNNYYQDTANYHSFNINGITNHLAITDIIEILGTPSHFYEVSDTCYYLDYFITKKDRRNGITIYINPAEDSILSVEFSLYK